jgi:hypothetical protein
MFLFKLIVGILMNIVIFGGLLFLPARTVEWRRAWVFRRIRWRGGDGGQPLQ